MAGRMNSGHRLVVPASVGVIGLALIGVGQSVPNRHSIQDDLTSRSGDALAAADLDGLSVTFSGRDATISGATSADRAARAEDVVGSVNGVRVATADLAEGDAAPAPAPTPSDIATATSTPVETSAPAETPTETPAETATETAAPRPDLPVGFTLADGTITVTGTVPSKSAGAALIDAAEATGNGWEVVDKLQVNKNLTRSEPGANRLSAVTRLLSQAPIDGTKLVIQYNRGSVILRGAPADADTESALLSAASATVAKKAPVIDGLDIPGAE